MTGFPTSKSGGGLEEAEKPSPLSLGHHFNEGKMNTRSFEVRGEVTYKRLVCSACSIKTERKALPRLEFSVACFFFFEKASF